MCPQREASQMFPHRELAGAAVRLGADKSQCCITMGMVWRRVKEHYLATAPLSLSSRPHQSAAAESHPLLCICSHQPKPPWLVPNIFSNIFSCAIRPTRLGACEQLPVGVPTASNCCPSWQEAGHTACGQLRPQAPGLGLGQTWS